MANEHGKKYRAAAAQIEEDRLYSVEEAAALVKSTAYTKFDSTIEVHLRLGIDPRHADQIVRGTAVLPHGTGKKIRILVFTQGEGERIAREAGADFVGNDELIKQIEGGWVDFDIAIATADMMGKVGRLGKILGRRGLMPSPKSGTIVQIPTDLPRVIEEVRRGKVEFRNESKAGLIHIGVGKVSFEQQQIVDNVLAVIDAINKAKPSGVKGTYVRSITVTSTMAPGIHLDVAPALAAATSA